LIPRLIVLVLLVASCGSADTPSTPSVPPALGDGCLVGRWIETKQYSPGNFGQGTGERFEVTGLEGLVITYTADGVETDDYSAAKPLNGGWRGNKIQIVVGGTITYQVHAEGGHIVQSKPVASLTVAYFANGSPLTGGTSSFAPATISYTCNGSFLHLETPPTRAGYGPQTDDLTRG
jgi:hypothetical protein